MNKNKRCLVNFFSKGREDYKKGTERLIESIKKLGIEIDILVYSPDFGGAVQTFSFGTVTSIHGYPNTLKYGLCPNHNSAPYLFKAFIIQSAREMGYETILWCDSSIILNKNPEHYFELVKETGIVTFDNIGNYEATWTSDDCLQQLGCSVEYARTFFQIEAAILLFNFNNVVTNELFEEYIKYGLDGICLKGLSGSTREDFKGHRHDQSVLSYLIRKYKKNPIDYGGWATKIDLGDCNPTFLKIGI